jgi:hypothetical protein
VSISTSPAPLQHPGTTIQITGLASSCSKPHYQFWKLVPGSSSWQLAQPYSIGTPTYSWSATGQVVGTYSFMVWAIDTQSGGAAGNSLGRWDSYNVTKYTLVSSNTCLSVSFTTLPSGTAPVGKAVVITASQAGCSSTPLYQFWMLAPGSSTWQIVQKYSGANSYTLIAGVRAPGTYNFAVWVRDLSSIGTFSSSLGRYDALTNSLYSLMTCTSITVTSTPLNTAPAGTNPVTITGTASGCSSLLFQFWMLAPGSSTWADVQPYLTNSGTFNWNTTIVGKVKGLYHFSVWVKDSGSTGMSGNSLGRWDAFTSLAFTLT